MKNFLITFKVFAPYERRYEYRIQQVWKPTRAIVLAWKQFKQEEQVKHRKKLGKIFIEVMEY